MPRTRTRHGGPSRESLLEVADVIARRTAGLDGGPLRFDAKLLDDEQRGEIVALTERRGALSEQEERRWQALVEKSSGKPGLFARLREVAEVGRELAELAAEASGRRFTRQEETRLLQAIGEQIAGGFLLAEDVGVLTSILAAIEQGKPLGPRSRVEGTAAGPRFVFDSSYGPLGAQFDPEGRFGNANAIVEHLARNTWFILTKNGAEWSLELGPRATAAMDVVTRKAA